MRSWLWIALIVSPASAIAADWKLDCPQQLSTAQSVTSAVPADWSTIARTVSTVKDVKQGASDTDVAPPVSVSVFDGSPVDMADLVPDDPNARVVRWTFAKNRTRDIYVVCHYADTRLALAHKAPAEVTTCQLAPNSPGVICR